MIQEIGDASAIADVVLNKLKHFTVGFGRAGETPAVKGSGVLIKHGERHGILTCAHVAEYLRELNRPIALVRLNRSLEQQQFGMIKMDEVLTYVAGEEPWTDGQDLAFIYLSPHLVGNIAKDSVFIDAEKNFAKSRPDDYSSLIPADSVFGLVEEFTGGTTRQGGRATTVLRGVLTSGILRDIDDLNITLECFKTNIPDLPRSFGGTSGGGLWRVYVRRGEDGSFEAVHHRLLGIAASQDIESVPPRIMCQGLGRIKVMLEDVQRCMSGEC